MHIAMYEGSEVSCDSRERRLKLLEERKSRYEESEHCEFTADEDMIGLIIGKQGEKLTRVAKQFKVEIRVLPDDGGLRRIRIYGCSYSTVAKARSMLEYIYEAYQVSQPVMLWILSNRGEGIKELSQRSGLHSAWLDDNSNTILLCGLRFSVENAVRILNTHSMRLQCSTLHKINIPKSQSNLENKFINEFMEYKNKEGKISLSLNEGHKVHNFKDALTDLMANEDEEDPENSEFINGGRFDPQWTKSRSSRYKREPGYPIYPTPHYF